MLDKLKPFLIIAGIIAAVFAWSYVNEGQYRAFEQRVRTDQAQAPFSRIIGTGQSADLGSPWSFFQSRTHLISIASPEPARPDWFRVVSYHFDEEEPSAFLVEADCQARSLRWFQERDPEGASELARNVFGEPIMGRTGLPLVLVEDVPPPDQWTASICDHDWTPERAALQRFQEERRAQ
jgi:hypothetical protein